MKYYLSALLSILFYSAAGQNVLNSTTVAPKEEIILHTDRDLYIVGEEVWFKAYCLEDNVLQSEFSKILYLELFDANKNVFIQEKYKLLNGITSSAFAIPGDLNSGNYFLRAYTQYQRNFSPEYLFTQVLSIINPQSEYQEVELPEKSEIKTATVNKKQPIVKVIQLKSVKQSYTQRALVEISFDAPFAEVTALSMTVRRKGSGHNSTALSQFTVHNPWLSPSLFNIQKTVPSKTINELKWIPEFRSLTLSGMIRNKKTKSPVNNVVCLTSVIGNLPQIHLSKTHKDGSFIFSFNELKGNQNLYLGLYPHKEAEDLEILVYNDFHTFFPDIKNIPLVFDSNLNAIYESLYLNYQLRNTFETIKPKAAFTIKNDVQLPFNLGKPNYSIDPNTFIDLPTLADIFREIIPSVSVYGRRGKRGLAVFSRRDDFSYKTPLILLDNIPVSDVEKLLLIEPAQVKTIEVYNSRYILGNHFLGGIISIKTSTDNFAGFKWNDHSIFVPFKAINQAKIFMHPDYSTSKTDTKPDFRTTLYWNPIIQSEVSNRFQFYTSDDCAVYEVIVKGFTIDGVPCFGKMEFEVKEGVNH